MNAEYYSAKIIVQATTLMELTVDIPLATTYEQAEQQINNARYDILDETALSEPQYKLLNIREIQYHPKDEHCFINRALDALHEKA